MGGTFGGDESQLQEWVDDTGVTFGVAADTDGTYGQYDRVGATAPFPLDVIIDRNGIVRYQSVGYDPDAMEAVILELLEE